MLVLHSLFLVENPALALWAEDSTVHAGPTPDATVHPFAVPAEALLELLPPGVGKTGMAPMALPSYASTLAASPELSRDPDLEPDERLRLSVRQVPVVTIEPAAVPSLLDSLAIPDCRSGASIHYLDAVVTFARDLVDRGRVLPSVIAGPTARWLPRLSGVDSARFATLRDAMPPVFRAESPERGPSTVLKAALDALVDSMVRLRLTEVRLTPPRRGRLAAADVATDAWLTALTGTPRFEADPVQVHRLTRRLEEWHASGVHEGPVRLCFRLSTPGQLDVRDEDPEPAWRLEFLLQAVDDPSVLVPASQVWRAGGSVLQRWVDRPDELLLTQLGQASRLYRGLDEALHQPHPVGLDLDAAEAYEFLTRATSLEQAGFGVLLPTWWRRPVELGLKLTTVKRSPSVAVTTEVSVEKKALVDFRWHLALGEDQLTEGELGELANAKVPLVQVRGQWVHIDQKRLAAGLAFLKHTPGGQASIGHLFRQIGLPPEDSGLPLPVISAGGEDSVGKLLSGQADRYLEPVPPPPGFKTTLRPYQRRGLAWLAFLDKLGIGACLADDMGLGKTVQLLALEALTRADERRPPTLVVCPMSVVNTWETEAARFAPKLAVHVHHGSARLSGEEWAATIAEKDLVITTYALAAKDAEILGAITWDRVVLDEAQNIKNAGSQQSRAVRALPARHRVALTGTPVENRLAELWSIMDFLNPGILSTANTFRARFAVPIERYGDDGTAARLRRVTGPFLLRRLKTDPTVITDLPEKIEMKQLCTLTVEQASLYQAVLDDMLGKIEASQGIARKGLVLATMSRLKQVCNHPAQLLGDGSRVAGRSGKLTRLEEILEEALAEGDKVLCFTQFTEFGQMLVPHLSARFDTEVLFLHGGTTKAARDAMVERFQAPGGPSIFLLSLKAGGTGLTLTAANQVVHLDRWWNPAVEDQATDRAFRIGQKRNVQVRKFVCIGTLEEKIDTMIQDKKALAQLVVGAGESWLTELSTSQFRDLVALSPGLTGE
ncbi:DEAD/DEAH box helicase [Amycolatopsis sp.]|uniref:DEAD/DEAH box helicase n=1 Tax=Amycolatopsis sp. TaxID=37632 RepID=UPI002E0AC15A|nr:DEAD/DEAH box helicase [Amycolatopsis sp.]